MDYASALSFYESALEQGTDPGTKVGWLSGEGYQIANFIVMCEGLEDGASVLDVGCGLGALLDYLAMIGRRVEYVGVDISPKVVEQARALHPGAVFEVRDILEAPPARRFDVVVCSGTLNFRIPDHERWMGGMLARMYELADHAVIANFLSAAMSTPLAAQLADRGQFVRVRPEDVVRHCRTFAPDITVADAWASSFCVTLRRPRKGTVAELARALGVVDGDSLQAQALIEIAIRRRLFAPLRDLLLSFPQSPGVVEWLARIHAWLGDRVAALAAFERVCALSPERAEPCASLGRLLFDAGRDEEAQTWLREALRRDPTSANGRYGLVVSLRRAGQHALAREVALAAPAGPLRDVLDGETAADPDQALAAYERALAAAPRFVDALAGAATQHELRGRFREAAAVWERAVAVAGDDPRVRERYTNARTRAGHV